MAELREQLQSALGSTYSIERELGGGGMSRVFFGRETALGRDVVVKVLHPELASGVNVDRFKREIQLAAQLQHPHIVPILAAGEIDGLPYLTMPFVAGRSLREKLNESGALPIDEAVDILRDVARALAYAHGRGVIHRDIKPDNVLLAEGAATVTDFGVAKAVSAARTGPTSTLTSIGTSIGTPTYMAPEQAAGDPSTDHRADIYAWGVMAYELLAGRPPFNEKSPHKLLAAHMATAPEPITDYRPDVPPGLAALVMQCLAKDPGERPQAANDVLRRLSEVATPTGGGHESLPAISLATKRTLLRALSVYAVAFVGVAVLADVAIRVIGLPEWVLPGTLVVMALGLPAVLFTAYVNHGARVARTMAMLTPGSQATANSTMTRLAVKASPHVSWRRTAMGGATAVGLFGLGVLVFMILRALGIGPAGTLFAKGVLAANDQLIVTDFRAPSDSSLGGVVSEAVRSNLAQSKAVRVMQTSQVAAALGRMRRPPTTFIDVSTARDLAQREGIKGIVDGEVTPLGAGFIVNVRLLNAASGDVLASFPESAKDAGDLVPAIDRVTRKLRDRMGESLRSVNATVPLEQATTPSLEALRHYTAGYRANALEQNYPKAIAELEQAIKFDSNFASAYRTAAQAYANARLNPLRRDSLADRAFELRDRVPEIERVNIEASYYMRSVLHPDREKAMNAYIRWLALDPTLSPNNLALLYADRRQLARSESLYKAGLQQANPIAFLYSNLIAVLAAEGKRDEVAPLFDALKQRYPGSARLPITQAIVYYVRGQWDSVETTCNKTRGSQDPLVRIQMTNCIAEIAQLRGQIGQYARIGAEAARIDSARGAPGLDIILAENAARLDVQMRNRPEAGVKRLDSLLAARPMAKREFARQDYVAMVELYSRAGRADRARALFAEYSAGLKDTATARLTTSSRHLAAGYVALAEHRYPEAIREIAASDTEYDGFPAGVCEVCNGLPLAQAYDAGGQVDRAIPLYERFVSSTDATAFTSGLDGWYLVDTYRRLGELYEAKGDKRKAAGYYQQVLGWWKNADPELQPTVTEVRKRLARLGDLEKR